MKKALCFFVLFLFSSSAFVTRSFAEAGKPDTVNVGIYVTSIHDINFKDREYAINLWLWMKYKRQEFDFLKNLEVPMAKKFERSYATLDTLADGSVYVLMKLQCIMKGTWKINDFPFDRQTLRFAIENSEYDAGELVFSVDSLGGHYGKYFLNDWVKDSFNIRTEVKEYGTGFGDPELKKPFSEYSTFKVNIVVHRESWELFFKIFIGMYISFLIAWICFYIHPDNMDARLTLSVGALFAVIGNKYIIDSALPENNTFTLVDSLHGITLFCIFIVIVSSVYTLNLIKKGEGDKAKKQNTIAGWVFLLVYILLNAWLIINAHRAMAIN